jgi:hypothetical protein
MEHNTNPVNLTELATDSPFNYKGGVGQQKDEKAKTAGSLPPVGQWLAPH